MDSAEESESVTRYLRLEPTRGTNYSISFNPAFKRFIFPVCLAQRFRVAPEDD